MIKLWLVQQFVCGMYNARSKQWEQGTNVFEFVGVFDNKLKAVEACRDENYIVTPIELNKQLPHETVMMEGGYYPLQKKSGKRT